jgi:hypothetical protein
VSTRYYLQNAAAPYTPTTKRGAWDTTGSSVVKALDTTKSGTNTAAGVAEDQDLAKELRS